MTRPYLPDFVIKTNYTVQLEKYCDFLENALHKNCSLLAYEFSACAYPATDECDHNCVECWEKWSKENE